MIVFRSATLASPANDALLNVEGEFPTGSVSSIAGGTVYEGSLVFASILGLVRPLTGEVLVERIIPAENSLEIRRRLTFVPSGAPLLGHLTAIEQVKYLAALTNGEISRNQVVDALRMCEVPDRLHRAQTSRLTLLQRFLVWLAASRVRASTIFLVQDPTAGLTSRHTRLLAELIRENCGPTQTCIVSSRDPEFAARIADRAFRISQQQLEQR